MLPDMMMLMMMGGMWTPKNIPNLILWLDATAISGISDGDVVTTWIDKSGGGRNYTQATAAKKPLYKTGIMNGRPVVRFDGSDDFLSGALVAGTNKTVFIVAQKNSPVGSTQTLLNIAPNSQVCTDSTLGDGISYYWTSNFGGAITKPTLLTLVYSGTSSLLSYINGWNQKAACNPADDFSTSILSYIGTNNSGTQAGDFDVAEIIIYNSSLSDYDRKMVERYLINKWNTGIWKRQGTVLSASEAYESHGAVMEPNVIYEGSPQILTGATNVFKMWYTGGSSDASLCYAESLDGVTWSKYASNPIVSAHNSSSIAKVGSVYCLYASRIDRTQIDLYTSSDGVTFALDTAACVPLGASGQWDDGGVANTHVWQEAAGDWRMLYEAYSTATHVWRSGYATSSDGKAWSKSISNPVLPADATGGPHIHKIGSTFWLWCHQSPTGNLPTDFVRYYSSDCITWTKYPAAFRVFSRETADEGVGLSVGQVADIWLVELNGQTYMWYTATPNGNSDTSGWHIKLAIAPYTIADLTTTIEGY